MRIAVFGIHPDDIEIGCGGTVALAAGRGDDVVLVDLTRGECSSNGTVEERATEALAAAHVLSCPDRRNLGIADAGIQSEHPGQQELVVASIRDIQPDLVLMPTSDDPHPDHCAGSALIRRSLYLSGIHGYESDRDAWRVPQVLIYAGRNEVRADVVVDISKTFRAKIDAIKAHRSQFDKGSDDKPTPLNTPDYLSLIEARARVLGHTIGTQFGEAFETTNPIALSDLGIFGHNDE